VTVHQLTPALTRRIEALLSEVEELTALPRSYWEMVREAGRYEGQCEADEQWSKAIAGMKELAERPTAVELQRIRAEVPYRRRDAPAPPCGRTHCRGCSWCTRVLWVERHGGDYDPGRQDAEVQPAPAVLRLVEKGGPL
jgi:hypothetical protein